jgi:hypothetical protein
MPIFYWSVEFNCAVECMRREELEARAIDVLSNHLPGHWEPMSSTTGPGRDRGIDLLLRREDGFGLVVVVVMTTIRVTDLLGRLALAAIQWESASRELPGNPVFVVAGNRIGRKTISEVELFMSQNLSNLEWGLIDARGTVRLKARSLALDVAEYSVPVRSESSSRHSRRLFSDLNRWMLKILLLGQMPGAWWGGPREKPNTPTELHRVAGVSVETAHRFVRTMDELDFIRRSRQGLKLVRVEAMVDAWMAAERLNPPGRIPVQWFISEEARLEYAFPPVGNTAVVVGGFEACRRHGILHTEPPGLEIHVDRNWRTEIEDWEVEMCESDEADLFLLESPYPQSVFKGSIRHDDLSTVDILQTALDVVHSPTRGMEQAEFVMEHVLSALPRDAR